MFPTGVTLGLIHSHLGSFYFLRFFVHQFFSRVRLRIATAGFNLGEIFDRLPFPRRSRTKVRNRFVLQIFSRPACTLTTNQGPKIWLLGKELKFVHEILYEEIFTIPAYLRLLRSDGRVLNVTAIERPSPIPSVGNLNPLMVFGTQRGNNTSKNDTQREEEFSA